jgi:hypothetical protein
MVKTPPNSGKSWTQQQVSNMKKLVKQNTPTPLIGYKLGRSPASVQSKASEIGVSLKPTNKSPYGTPKKK